MRLNANTDMNLDYLFMEREIEESLLEQAYEWFEKTFDFEEKEELREAFEGNPIEMWRESRCDV